MVEANFDQRRTHLVDYIQSLGISDERVLDAFRKVPRHAFVLPEYINKAYEDIPLPIGEGQVITQPSLVATMTQALVLTGDEKVLEIGTGSGYQAAILSHMAREVYTIERIKKFAQRAKEIFNRLGLDNIHVFIGDGTLGLPQYAPYDAIMVTAAGPEVPQPFVDQLQEGGRLVIPVAEDQVHHTLKAGIKRDGTMHFADIEPVRFVPLIGKYGWQPKP
jgi:protein-L-isoaspartate(D-aspartate) O-methyltransferase